MKTAARVTRLVVALVALSAMFAGGCGSVEDPPVDAPAKCAALRAVFCGRVLACQPAGTLTQAQCEAAFSSSLDCGRAVAVGPSFDRCLAELPSFDCAIFDSGANPPASCRGAVLTGNR